MIDSNLNESFYALQKRCFVGQTHIVIVKHLHINEFAYRYNIRVFELTIERALGVA